MNKTLKSIDRKILLFKLLGYFGIACFVVPIFAFLAMFVYFNLLGLDIDTNSNFEYFPIIAIVGITLFACSTYILRYSVEKIKELQLAKIRAGLLK